MTEQEWEKLKDLGFYLIQLSTERQMTLKDAAAFRSAAFGLQALAFKIEGEQ